MNVPEWNGHYPTLQSSIGELGFFFGYHNVANDEQEAFYFLWKEEFEKGNAIDLEGSLAYIFCYLYETVRRYIEDEELI